MEGKIVIFTLFMAITLANADGTIDINKLPLSFEFIEKIKHSILMQTTGCTDTITAKCVKEFMKDLGVDKELKSPEAMKQFNAALKKSADNSTEFDSVCSKSQALIKCFGGTYDKCMTTKNLAMALTLPNTTASEYAMTLAETGFICNADNKDVVDKNFDCVQNLNTTSDDEYGKKLGHCVNETMKGNFTDDCKLVQAAATCSGDWAKDCGTNIQNVFCGMTVRGYQALDDLWSDLENKNCTPTCNYITTPATTAKSVANVVIPSIMFMAALMITSVLGRFL